MESIYSPWLLNVDCYPGKVAVRNGYVIHSTVVSSPGFIKSIGTWGAKAVSGTYDLFALAYDNGATKDIVYDVTTSTPASTIATTSGASTKIYPFYFSKRLAFISDSPADLPIYDGTTWTTWGFTLSGSPFSTWSGVFYKGRAYCLSGSTLVFSDPKAVSGAMTSRDFYEYLENGTVLTWGGSISSPGERANEQLFVFGNAAGEVLVYSGTYPDAPDWELIAKFKVSPALGYNSFLSINYDIYIFTETGVVSVRELLSSGDKDLFNNQVSANVNDYWTSLIKQLNSNFWNGSQIDVSSCYWPERNQLLVLIPGSLDNDGTYNSSVATMAVFHTISKGWSFHTLSNVSTARLGGLTYFNGNIYFYTQNVVMKSSLTGYKDEAYNSAGNYSSYSYEIQGAYTDLGSSIKNKKVVGVQPIIKTDFAGSSVTMKVAADMGRKVSDASSVELVSGYSAPYYSVGVDGTFVQYRMLGTSDTASSTGLELFATTFFVVPGGRG